MTVSEVLIGRTVGLSLVVSLCLCRGGSFHYGSLLPAQRNVAPQVDGVGEIDACREHHEPTTVAGSFLNRCIDGRRVDMHAVALRPEICHVIDWCAVANRTER